MRKSLIVLCCAAAFACQRNGSSTRPSRVTTTNVASDAKNARIDTVIQPAPVYLDKSLLGDKLGQDGTVSEQVDKFNVGDKVFFTMMLHESPVGLKTQAKWIGPNKNELHREERDMKGGKVVTYSLDTKSLKPGKYKVEGYWGGNLAAEKDFAVNKGSK